MHIGFFCLQASIRLQRLMECVRRSGKHKITFLTSDMALAGPQWEGLCDQVIDERPALLRRQPHFIKRFYGGWLKRFEIPRIAKTVRRLDCDLWHVFGDRSNQYARAVVENARCPVIFDSYDFSSIDLGMENLRQAEREAEQFCLENAEAIVTKFPEEVLDYFRRRDYRLPTRVLHFQDYCDERQFSPISLDAQRPAAWHVVQGGGVSPLAAPPERFGYQQYHGLARTLAEQGVHFHLYPSPNLAAVLSQFQCYRDLAGQEPLFHFHDPLPYAEFRRALGTYHWGAWIHPPVSTALPKETWHGIGNKLTTYAEAGLPLIINNELPFGASIVRNAGIGVTFDWKDVDHLREILDAADWRRVRKNLADFREDFSIVRQGPKLMTFYQETISRGRR